MAARSGCRVDCGASTRALLDFAAEADPGELEAAIAEGCALERVSESELVAAADRVPKRAGVAALRAELRREGGPQWTRSEAERRMLRLVREARLPRPVTNRRVEGWPADFLWQHQRLIVEVDGYRFHSHRAAFERDRKRDAAHVLAGYRVIRVTWHQLCEEPVAVAVTIARALELTRAA